MTNTTRTWSPYQTALFDFVKAGKGNAIVRAVAGSGKSTTSVEAMRHAKGSVIFLAFNKAIADELKERGVNARTFHSLTFTPVTRSRKQNGPEMDKLKKLIRQSPEFNRDDIKLYQSFMTRLVGLARGVGIGCLLPNTDEQWFGLVNHHELELESEDADVVTAVELSKLLLSISNDSPMVDFDDMLYFAVKDNIVLPKFDTVFVDEAQDTNPIQREILRKIMTPTSRLIAVGDPAQAIYGFRGADSNSMRLIQEEFNCVELPLTITYRCATSIVSYAQRWVKQIEAAPTAPQGEVKTLGSWNAKMFQPNDLVVCRKSAPLLTAAFKFIKARVPVQVMGRDIGQGLKALIKKMNAGQDIDLLKTKLEAWADREIAAAQNKNDEAKVEQIGDRLASLLTLMEGLKEDRRTVAGLEQGIDYLFKDKADAVIFATIHKSKGLEANRVWWLERSQCPSKWAKGWQAEQEENLCYVATTRAKSSLFLIEPENFEE